MTEYNKMAKGRFVVTGSPANAKIINLPFVPDYVEFINYTASASGADNGVPNAHWDALMGQNVAVIDRFQAANQLTTDTVDTFGISTFQGGLSLQYGAQQLVSTITNASPAVVTASAAHGLKSGDVVVFQNIYQTTTTGMQQIAGIPFTVTVTAATTFTIPWDASGSNYTSYTFAAQATRASFKKVLYPYLYFPGTSFISAITAPNGTTIPTGTVQVDTTSAHNFVIGQEVAFRLPVIWGAYELNSLPNVIIPGSPIYGYVVTVTDYNTVIVQIAASASFTAFNVNQIFASFPGEKFPQIVAVGDVNTGGVQISNGSALYPPPYSVPFGDGSALTNGAYAQRVDTINGPAIQGAYVNNTSQGFIIGSGTAQGDAAAVLIGAAEDVIYWRAFLHDVSIPR